jgi:predicted DNA-binding protein
MKRKNTGRSRPSPWIRASISFPVEIYRALDALAIKKKVSLAWIVRDAAERYIEHQGMETAERGHAS